jgi:gamma-glutamyl-gamma-aminobutyrate hydrolase PuuD
MEFINTYFGGKICRSTDIAGGLNHDETRHDVTIAPKAITEALGGDSFEVNSYHRMVIGAGQLSSQLRSFAVASDGTIEGFYHPQHAIGAVVWHPEREVQPHILNEFLIKAFFSRELFWQKRKASTV